MGSACSPQGEHPRTATAKPSPGTGWCHPQSIPGTWAKEGGWQSAGDALGQEMGESPSAAAVPGTGNFESWKNSRKSAPDPKKTIGRCRCRARSPRSCGTEEAAASPSAAVCSESKGGACREPAEGWKPAAAPTSAWLLPSQEKVTFEEGKLWPCT